jgi:hypothetical protein
MHLAYTHGRPIGEVKNLQTSQQIGTAPIEFSAEVSAEGAAILSAERAPFYRAADGEQRFTVTIDSINDAQISGTIRRR